VQVPLFLKLGDKETALQNAVESGDANIIYDVLLSLKAEMSLPEYQVRVKWMNANCDFFRLKYRRALTLISCRC
jgi:hypothetical protein